ncbi:hypothetical protein ON010_g11997 [Phytophthora cinnamomi]|nr:hypothetical protein ON010_g11997 [Phytophthora cinnamomi]
MDAMYQFRRHLKAQRQAPTLEQATRTTTWAKCGLRASSSAELRGADLRFTRRINCVAGGRGPGAHGQGALHRARGGQQHVLVPDAEDAALLVALPPLQQAPRAAARVARLLLHGAALAGGRGFSRQTFNSVALIGQNRLDPEDSPESNDIILVRRRVAPTTVAIPSHSDEAYFATMRELFLSEAGSDITLEVGPDREILRAHRLILTTRCEIFEAMFRPGAMRESEVGVVQIEDHSPEMVSKMLEFIYTNRVMDLGKLNSNYLLLPLKHICEVAAQDVLSVGNVGRFLCAAEKFNAAYLKEYCLAFFMDHTNEIIDDENFREEIESCPSIALTILRASTRNVGSSLEPVAKRRRLNMPFDDPEY